MRFLLYALLSLLLPSVLPYNIIKVKEECTEHENRLNKESCTTTYSNIKYRNFECSSIPIFPCVNPFDTIKINTTLSELEAAFQDLGRLYDDDNSFRDIFISITKSDDQSLSTSYFRSIGKLLDKFLIPRPWYRLNHEPTHMNFHKRHVIIIRRLSQWSDYLKFISSVQYPSSGICNNSYMVVNRQTYIHPGWGSVLDTAGKVAERFKFDIYTSYLPPDPFTSDYSNAVISPNDCTEDDNIWNCAFLQTTNCTLPTVITKDQRVYSCKSDETNCFKFETISGHTLLNKAASDGQLVTSNEKDLVFTSTPKNSVQDILNKKYTNQEMKFKYILPKSKKLRAKYMPYESNVRQFMYGELFLFRQAYLYREFIANMINEYRLKSKFLPNKRCIAVHMRRGDRVIFGKDQKPINMTEYCYNITHPNADGSRKKCLNENSEHSDCPEHDYDRGCSDEPGYKPFGSISLSEIIHTAKQLGDTGIRDLVVLTDDPEWIENERRSVELNDSSWNIHFIQPPTSSRRLNIYSNYYKVRRDGTKAGTYLFANFKLAQQCEGLVAHFGSAVAYTLYHLMCFHHAGIDDHCPPMLDLATFYA